MKKMLIAVAVVLAAGMMTSCNKGEGCYKLTGNYKLAGVELSQTVYVYGEGEDIDAAKQELKRTLEGLGAEVKITQTKVAKNQEDCNNAN